MGATLETTIRISAMAQCQHGVVSRRQLIDAGVHSDAIRGRIAQRQLLPIYQGVYAVGRPVVSSRGRWMAAVMAGGTDAALARRSAAELWGFGTFGRTISEVVRPFNRRPGDRPLERNSPDPRRLIVRRSRHLPDCELTTVDGIPVTSVSRTLLDLASMLGRRRLLQLIGEADRMGLLNVEEMAQTLNRGRGWRGLVMLRELIGEWHGLGARTRSDLEMRFVRLCRSHRLPDPEPNVRVLGFEVDCLWRKQRVIVELDGFAFHHGAVAFEKDRARDLVLESAGFRVVRVTHRMLERRSGELIERLTDLLRTSR